MSSTQASRQVSFYQRCQCVLMLSPIPVNDICFEIHMIHDYLLHVLLYFCHILYTCFYCLLIYQTSTILFSTAFQDFSTHIQIYE